MEKKFPESAPVEGGLRLHVTRFEAGPDGCTVMHTACGKQAFFYLSSTDNALAKWRGTTGDYLLTVEGGELHENTITGTGYEKLTHNIRTNAFPEERPARWHLGPLLPCIVLD